MKEISKNSKNEKSAVKALKYTSKPRQNWKKAFKEMAKNGDDKLLIPDIFEEETF